MRKMFFLLCLLPACDGAWDDMPNAHVHANAVRPDQQEAWSYEVSRRIGSWNVLLEERGCEAPFQMADDGHEINLIPEADWPHNSRYAGLAFGDDVWGPGRIDIKGDLAEQHGGALLHELGHAMGLGHTDPADGPSIMLPVTGESRLLDRDLEAAACLLGCGPCD